ncbi:pirin family protein [Hypericibacter sp.]|uniref:pirin family protein n=1 Tax=Hypericibacter sp. TaxID=2705401 RepID=UPI003D6D39B1
MARSTPKATAKTAGRSEAAAIHRRVAALFPCVPTTDGAGVKISRIIGTPRVGQIDPFLLFDQFGSDDPNAYISGFPDHPHRGFETVTYMLAGRMRHKDNHGHEGVLGPGGVQWMTAGRGIIHSEMPEQTEGLMKGFQLWVNLPAALKMREPRYQEFEADQLSLSTPAPGVTAKVIAGTLGNRRGPVEGISVDPLYADLRFEPKAALEVPVTTGHTLLLFVFDGDVTIGDVAVPTGSMAVMGSEGEALAMTAGAKGASAMLLAAAPIGEPVVRHGPFVMNTREEIQQALEDYYLGRL